MQRKLPGAARKIQTYFQRQSGTIFSSIGLREIFNAQKNGPWGLSAAITFADFLTFCLEHKYFNEVVLRSIQYAKVITRYCVGTPVPFAIALSIRKSAYLSHGTAAYLHQLNPKHPPTIYLNVEQSAKPRVTGALTQVGIDRAFTSIQRQSNLVYTNEHMDIAIINGKQSGRLGVETISGPDSKSLEATNLERTLIDIVVRPAYAGGITQVLEAYRSAKDRASATKMASILNALDFLYPYSQAIGFLMQRAGFSEPQYRPFKPDRKSFKFYLTHRMLQPRYDDFWRLYYPENLAR